MRRAWEPEIDLTADQVRRMVQSRFPALDAQDVRPLAEGWNNALYLVDGQWLFRFPRRKSAAALLEVELALLPGLALRLPLRVPYPLFTAEPTPTFPHPWYGYAAISGRAHAPHDASEATLRRAARRLGRFLRVLHAVDPAQGRRWGLPPDTLRRLDVAGRRGKVDDRLSFAVGAGYGAVVDCAREVLRDTPSDLPLRGDVLIHGDLHPRQVLFDDTGDVSGVIDWGDAHLGDPACDLSLAWSLFPPGVRGELLDAYGPVDERTRALARFRAVYIAIAHLAQALDTGDDAQVDMAARAITWASA